MGGGLPDSILAQVNEEKITVDEFEREMKEVILEPGREGKGEGLRRSEEGLSGSGDRAQDSCPGGPRLGIKLSP